MLATKQDQWFSCLETGLLTPTHMRGMRLEGKENAPASEGHVNGSLD